ncbi:MAG: c-type cytochrome [Planctomycetes bacterium]|nr:c-type cytochrome [Planctomycetota bacterium]
MRRRHALAIAAAMALVTATCATRPDADDPAAPIPTRGAELYARHCASCHGATGDADTAVAALLLPKPNPFRAGLFKLVSTRNGMPTEDDLVRTLYFGMPGSTMMSWSWLPKADLVALAREVRRLAIAGRADSIRRTAAITGQSLDAGAAAAQAERELTPGEVVDVGDAASPTDATLREGRELFLRHCASCHGTDGRGLSQLQSWPTGSGWLQPRDFTSGYLRADSSHRELAFRVLAGMPAAHMPPAPLAAGECAALVAWVRTLLPDGAGERHAQWRRTVRVAKVDDLDAELRLDRVRLPVVPLWWRPDACDEVWLRAAHDDREIRIELSWADGTRDDRVRPGAAMGDGVAIQFAGDREPPLLPMGSSARPVNVWRWHTYDPKALAGIADLVGGQPHGGLDVAVPLQLEPLTESMRLGGPDSVGHATGSGLPIHVETVWHDGSWHATFRRALAARSPAEIDLTGAEPVLFALAVWDAAIDPHPGSKAITTWHALELER